MADLYRTAGADRIMSVDLHASQEQGFFDGPVDHLFAMPVLVDYVRGRVDLSNTAVVSPDAGRIRVAEKWSKKLGGAPLASFTRPATRLARTLPSRTASSAMSLARNASWSMT